MWVGGFQEMRTDVEVTGLTFGLPGGLGGPVQDEGVWCVVEERKYTDMYTYMYK